MEVKSIISEAIKLGACQKSSKASDWKSLAWLLFSPQGREFCASHNFPSLEAFRGMPESISEYGVYVDDVVEAHNADVALIGEGESVLRYDGTDKPYKVMLMHGANARIYAANYAVVNVCNISGDYEVFNDGTATIL